MAATYSLTLRSTKGSKLTIDDMDNNLLYLQSISGGGGGGGSQGPQGPQGNNGSQGSQGSQGPQGNDGGKGSNGTNGSQGPQGPQGPGSGGSLTGTPSQVLYFDEFGNVTGDDSFLRGTSSIFMGCTSSSYNVASVTQTKSSLPGSEEMTGPGTGSYHIMKDNNSGDTALSGPFFAEGMGMISAVLYNMGNTASAYIAGPNMVAYTTNNNFFNFPSNDGNAGDVMITDGHGMMSFTTSSGGGGTITGPQTQILYFDKSGGLTSSASLIKDDINNVFSVGSILPSGDSTGIVCGSGSHLPSGSFLTYFDNGGINSLHPAGSLCGVLDGSVIGLSGSVSGLIHLVGHGGGLDSILAVYGGGGILMNMVGYIFPDNQGKPNTQLTNDGNGNLNWSTANKLFYDRILPTDGGTFTIPDNSHGCVMNLNANGSLSSFTVILPSKLSDGYVVNISVGSNGGSNTISALTIVPYSMSDSIFSAATFSVGGSNASGVGFVYNSTDTAWFRLY